MVSNNDCTFQNCFWPALFRVFPCTHTHTHTLLCTHFPCSVLPLTLCPRFPVGLCSGNGCVHRVRVHAPTHHGHSALLRGDRVTSDLLRAFYGKCSQSLSNGCKKGTRSEDYVLYTGPVMTEMVVLENLGRMEQALQCVGVGPSSSALKLWSCHNVPILFLWL